VFTVSDLIDRLEAFNQQLASERGDDFVHGEGAPIIEEAIQALRSARLGFIERKSGGQPTSEQGPVTYTIDQIDEAIRAIAGEWAVRRGDPSWNRPSAMTMAAEKAWIAERVEDEHSARLRAALLDLAKYGWLKPMGPWPDE
jgi:hypothetical protein